MPSTSFTKKVDLVQKMVSNTGLHLKKKSGLMMNAQILTTLLKEISQQSYMTRLLQSMIPESMVTSSLH